MSVQGILEEVRELTPAEQLALASLIIQQAQNAITMVEPRARAVNRVRGILKGLPGLDAFMAEKEREIDLEDTRGAA